MVLLEKLIEGYISIYIQTLSEKCNRSRALQRPPAIGVLFKINAQIINSIQRYSMLDRIAMLMFVLRRKISNLYHYKQKLTSKNDCFLQLKNFFEKYEIGKPRLANVQWFFCMLQCSVKHKVLLFFKLNYFNQECLT